jgi:hypothetical protein
VQDSKLFSTEAALLEALSAAASRVGSIGAICGGNSDENKINSTQKQIGEQFQSTEL